MRVGRKVLFLFVISGAVILSGCSNATAIKSNSGNTNGVTSSSILVGGVASLTGPLTADFAPVFNGVEAYFDAVNASGGVDGRKINFAYPLDDGSNPSQDVDQVRNLISQFHVFAVVGVATPSFAGLDLLKTNNVPTFGMAINPGWGGPSNLFGVGGSFTNFTSPQTEVAYLAQQLHVKTAAVLAYDVSESYQGCEGVVNGLQKFGIKVGFQDFGIPAPAVDLTSDIARIKSSGSDLVVSCMDVSGNLLMSQELKAANMTNVSQYWLDGYDPSTLSNPSNTSLMDGVYFLIGHAPFSVAETDPSLYSGMVAYLSAMKEYFPNVEPSEASINGWLSADLFVQGLKKVGRDLTRENLISAINSMTDYTAGGILPPVDWKVDHAGGNIDCQAFVQAEGSTYIPRFGSGSSAFTCFPSPISKGTIKPLNAVPPGG